MITVCALGRSFAASQPARCQLRQGIPALRPGIDVVAPRPAALPTPAELTVASAVALLHNHLLRLLKTPAAESPATPRCRTCFGWLGDWLVSWSVAWPVSVGALRSPKQEEQQQQQQQQQQRQQPPSGVRRLVALFELGETFFTHSTPALRSQCNPKQESLEPNRHRIFIDNHGAAS